MPPFKQWTCIRVTKLSHVYKLGTHKVKIRFNSKMTFKGNTVVLTMVASFIIANAFREEIGFIDTSSPHNSLLLAPQLHAP